VESAVHSTAALNRQSPGLATRTDGSKRCAFRRADGESSMIALMSPEKYAEFQSLRTVLSVHSDTVAHVFVPVGPAPESVPIRLLFIGRATRDYSEDRVKTYQGAIARDEEIAHKFLVDRKSPLWQFIDDVVEGVRKEIAPSFPRDRRHELSGWSNLAKIGDIHNNPSPEMIKRQASLCILQLRSEMHLMSPHVIIILTRNYAEDEILYPVFGRDNWRWDNQEQDRVAFKKFELDSSSRAIVIWTNHPQAMGPRGYRAEATRMTIELAIGALTGKELPPSQYISPT
jgi:hypothetical protein